jgi:predicted amidohydrolase YtcJ
MGAALLFVQGLLAAEADIVLRDGRILTVDPDFSVHEALAVKDGRVLAVGTADEVDGHVGSGTEVINLNGKTVIPGLIDNHVHIVRGSRQWHRDVRLTGVHSRAEARRLISERARKLGPGEWVVVMGGFTPHQFDDDRSTFSRQELDEVAPDNPVFMQLLFGTGFANTQAFRAIGIEEDTEIAWLEIASDIDLDADEQPTGVVRGAAMRRMLAKIAEPEPGEARARALGLIGDLHAMGVTSVIDAAGSGLTLDFYDAFESLDREGRLKLRIFSLYSPPAYGPGQEGQLTGELEKLAFFQQSDFFQRVGVGERLYNPIHDSMLQPAASSPQHRNTFAGLARQVAAKGLSLQQHATHPASMAQHLDAYEEIDKTYPIGELRWAFHHADGIDGQVIERAKALGMGIASHSRRLISGRGFNHPLPMLAFGNPPLRTLQDSGITWGLGTDTMVVNQSNPFYTLWWAVSGQAMNGDQLTDQTVSREEALVAHTRSNAWLAFREHDLGSLEPGKLADLLVLDRDYLDVPQVQIRTIKPLITMVGGEIVYRAP